MKIGEQIYSCSPNVAERSFNDSSPQKPQLLTIKSIITKKAAPSLLVLGDDNGCEYIDGADNCSKDLKEAEEIYQKQKKIYVGGLLSDVVKFVDNPTLLEQLNKIREELIGDKNGG